MSCNCSDCSSCKIAQPSLGIPEKGISPIYSIFYILTEACNLRCRYCLPAGTKILMPDFSTVDIEHIKVGDIVMGYDEYAPKGIHRKVYPVKVNELFVRQSKTIVLKLSNGQNLEVTPEHPILNTRGSSKYSWKEAGKYKIGDQIRILPEINLDHKANCDNLQYKTGYFVAAFLGDGSFKKYSDPRNGNDMFRIRLAVKDDEIIQRVTQYANDLGISLYARDFLISTKFNIKKPALFSNTRHTYEQITKLIEENLNRNQDFDYLCGFLAGIYDTEGNISSSSRIIRIHNSDRRIIQEIINGMTSLDVNYIEEQNKGTNKPVYSIRILNKDLASLRFLLTIHPAVLRKGYSNYHNTALLTSAQIIGIEEGQNATVYNFETESHTYIANTVAVHNCFVHQKPKFMSLDVAMDTTKWVIQQAEAVGKSPITNFFGGEPLLMWDEIIVPVTEYVRNVYKKPFQLGITTNGVLLDEHKMKFIKENDIGVLFSFDGPKEVQDFNRPLANGGSSFDILAPKIPMILEAFPHTTFRSTFDVNTADKLVDIHKFAVEMGYNNIFCIADNIHPWTSDKLQVMKDQIHDLADYWMDLLRQDKYVRFDPFNKAMRHIHQINDANTRGVHRVLHTGNKYHAGYGKCGVGGTSFASVNHKGDIYSCQELVSSDEEWAKQFKIGNIYTGVDDKYRIELTSKFDVNKVRCSNEKLCDGCMLTDICEGQCVINNLFANGNDYHIVPEVTCVYQQTALQEMIRVMNTMAEERNELFKGIFEQARKGAN